MEALRGTGRLACRAVRSKACRNSLFAPVFPGCHACSGIGGGVVPQGVHAG